MMEDGSSPGSYVGFTKFDSASAAQSAYQVAPEWSDMKVRGTFDTLSVIDNLYVPKTFGDTGSAFEPITNSYPQYGAGGYYQLKVPFGTRIPYNDITIIGD